MPNSIQQFVPLARRCETAIHTALAHAYLENVNDRLALFLLSLATQAARSSGAVALLLEANYYTQALAVCRSMLETLAIASFITREKDGFKLVEKQTLEKLRLLFEETAVPHDSAQLAKAINERHPDHTRRLRIENLLSAFEAQFMPNPKGNLFYLGYRRLCGYSHPDFGTLIDAVKVDGRTLRVSPDEVAMRDELSLGLGLTGAVGSCALLTTELGGFAFRPDTAVELEKVLNEAMDLVGRKDDTAA